MTERFNPKPSQNAEIRINGCVTDMTLPNGKIRIIYERDHTLPIDTSFIPLQTDGIFLEGTVKPKTRNSLNSRFRVENGDKTIKDTAQENGIPLIFHDVSETSILQVTHKIAEIATFSKILSPMALSSLTSLSTPEALAICSPFILDSLSEYMVYAAQRSTENDDKLADIYRVALKLAPFRRPYVLRLRNALWATKINWALEQGLGEHFTTIVGGFHTGLEKYLQREVQGKKARILRATAPAWSLFADLESYFSFRVFRQRKPKGAYDDIRVYEVPKLREIALGA